MSTKTANNKITAGKSFSLKDRLFNADTVDLLAQGLSRAYPDFKSKAYQAEVLRQFQSLELKACIECMADALVDYLPKNYSQAAKVLKQALPEPLDPSLSDDDFGDFIWSVPSEFAARQGCTDKRLKTSLALLKETTKRFSAEFAIRPFLKTFPDATYKFLEGCAQDENYHVRRLASEGIRPNLPWGLKIGLSTAKTIAMLNTLHADRTRFVTRSVANNLNDISKTDPEAVLDALDRWRASDQQEVSELEWMTKHALRGLIKADHPQALLALGYPIKPGFKLSEVKVAETVSTGDSLEWSATLTSTARQKLKVLLRVYFLKANGTHSAKVFALKDRSVDTGDVVALKKRLPFKPMTTRALYSGEHHVELVVNGVACGRKTFILIEK